MSANSTSTPASGTGRTGDPGLPDGRPGRRRRAHLAGRDAGHEAVGQALLISIGLAGMLAATRLAAVSMDGITLVMNALR